MAVVPTLDARAPDARRDLGAFFTPPEIADFLAAWAITEAGARVLEPASGEAVFIASAGRRLRALGAHAPYSQIVGVEIDPESRARSLSMLAPTVPEIHLADFLSLRTDDVGTFDAVIGNPPYVRYHRFAGEARARGRQAAADGGVRLSALASSWAPFVVHAASFVRPGGRMALVLPAELLSVDYATAVRDFLSAHFGVVTVLTFDNAMFPGALIDMVLLLAEKTAERQGLRVMRCGSLADFAALRQDYTLVAPRRWSAMRLASPVAQGTLQTLAASGHVVALGDLASVDIGMVTGANRYFVVSHSTMAHAGLESERYRATVMRPGYLRGAVIDHQDLLDWSVRDLPHLMLLFGSDAAERSAAVSQYVQSGADTGIAERFKCRIRKPWYALPEPRVPQAFLSYMSHRQPRVAVNQAGVTSTNSVHHINCTAAGVSPEFLVAALHSSLSLLSFELEGRSYGGGVLKTETKESERVLIPAHSERLDVLLSQELGEVDQALRLGEPQRARDLVDAVLVAEGVMTASDLSVMRMAHAELQQRRELRRLSQHTVAQ